MQNRSFLKECQYLYDIKKKLFNQGLIKDQEIPWWARNLFLLIFLRRLKVATGNKLPDLHLKLSY